MSLFSDPGLFPSLIPPTLFGDFPPRSPSHLPALQPFGVHFYKTTKPGVFVSYHHRLDQPFYDEFSRIFCDTYDVVQDNSPERAKDSDDVEYIMRSLRENHISGTSCTIVLCGAETRWRKFVDWEIDATLDKQHCLDGGLPKANIRLWKVAKIFHFLATFQVHPWTILTFHEPVPRRIDWPGKLVQEPLCGS
jgi:Thoeris protein ThsB, TIR-like domain